MKTQTWFAVLVVSIFASVASAQLQVAVGTPSFNSYGGGPFDTVNLGNLNVHFAIPILHKAGRGMSFTYDLGYDSSVWMPVTSGGTTSWTPVLNWGWRGVTEVQLGYATFKSFQDSCTNDNTGQQYYFTHYYDYTYHDPFGVSHRYDMETATYVNSKFCSTGLPLSATETAGDGSGYTMSVQLSSVTYVQSRSGTTLHPPVNNTNGAGSSIDANGNEITTDGNGHFYDTLSSSAAVLTVSGTGTPSSPMQYQYTAPSGATQIKVNYIQYTVRTAFGFTGSGAINEYGPLSNPLVSSIVLPDGSSYSFTYEPTPGSCTPLSGTTSCVTGRILSVTLPGGGTITYNNYSGGPHNTGIYGDGSTAGFNRQVNPGGTWTYARTDISGSHWQTGVGDPGGNDTVIDFQKDSGSTSNFYETQRLVYQGTTSGTLLSTTITCYANGTCPPSSVSSPINSTTVLRYLPNASGLQAETYSTYSLDLVGEVDEYDYGVGAVGSLIRKTITTYAGLGNGIVDRPSNVSIYDSGSHVTASTSYGYDETTPQPTSGTPQHVSITGSRGLLTSVTAQANGTTNLYRKYTYYDTGNLYTSTDVSTSSTTNGASTTYNYASGTASCGNSFVTSITEPLSLSRSMTWDCNGGVMLSLTDENGKTSSTAYSGSNYTNYFWRPYSTTDQAGTVMDYWYYLNSSNQAFQTESKYHTAFNSGNSTVDILTTTDYFGRTIFRQTKQSPSSSQYDTVATCYDSSGRVSLTTLPYSSAAITSTTTACPSNPGTSNTYDALNRLYTVSDSGGGSTTYSYTGNDVLQTLTTPTQSKQQEYDALGRLKSVCEITAGTTAFPGGNCAQGSPQTGYWTTYTYDVLDNMTGVTQNAQASSGHQTRAYVYDMLGRLTSETNPEMNNAATAYSYDSLSGDASCGTYTSAGNMLKRVDAAGNATCYSSYDALHRVGMVSYPPTSTPAKHFVYDTATVNGTAMTNAKTRLAEAYTCISTCSSKVTDLGFSYWPTGQTSDVWESTPNSGSYYHVTSNPWPNGVMNTLQNLSGLPNITYLADGEGRLGTASASSGQNPMTAVTYNSASQVTALTYGSSDSDSFNFNPNTGRMSQYQFSVGSSPKTDTGVFTWNSNGTLQQLLITDQLNSLNSQTCNYTQDDLGRLGSANCGSSIWSQTFAYDPFGNITKTVPNGATGTSFQVNYDYTNNTNRITTTPFSYTSTSDPSAKTGNMTNDGAHTYSWDSDGHVTGIDAGGSSGVCLTYDALGREVEKDTGSACSTSPTTSTEIVYSPAGAKLALMNGSSLVKAFVPLPGGAQAVYNSSGLQYYRHPDWLGSSRLATTTSRTAYYDVAYAPYGENYAGSGTKDLSFTGQNQDTESSQSGGAGGLYDFLYREHSPVQGRWFSPDPSGLAATSPSDPQSWNRYTYVRNRALSTIDLLGLDGGVPCIPTQIVSGSAIPLFEDPCGGGGGGGGGGGWCDPIAGCSLCPDNPDCIIPPIGGSGGGGAPPPPPSSPPRTGGFWPNNQTTGLPTGLGNSPFDLGGLIGLSPGTQCGDFINCAQLGGLSFSNCPCGDTCACPRLPDLSNVWTFIKLASLSVITAIELTQRCVEAKASCLIQCTDEVLMSPYGPTDRSGEFFKCMHACMRGAGCE